MDKGTTIIAPSGGHCRDDIELEYAIKGTTAELAALRTQLAEKEAELAEAKKWAKCHALHADSLAHKWAVAEARLAEAERWKLETKDWIEQYAVDNEFQYAVLIHAFREKLQTFLAPTNPADDPLACLACMNGRDDVRHTCPPPREEKVLVLREDLDWIVNLTERKSRDAKYSPKFLRLKDALDLGQEIPEPEDTPTQPSDKVLVRKIDLDGLIAAEDDPHNLVVVRREDLCLLILRDEDALFVAARNRIKAALGGE